MAKPIIRTLQLELGGETLFLTHNGTGLTMSWLGLTHQFDGDEKSALVDFLITSGRVVGPGDITTEAAEEGEKEAEDQGDIHPVR